MKFVKLLSLVSIAVLVFVSAAFSSSIEVDTNYDFKLALDYAFSAKIDTIILIESGGNYTTADTMYLTIKDPIVIMAKPGLAEKPIFRHGDLDSSVIEIFRIFDDVTFDGIIFDGYNAIRPMKAALRVGHSGLTDFPRYFAKEGLNITIQNCEFQNFFPPNWQNDSGGHALYFLRPETGEPAIKTGTVRIENCKFTGLGDEAIRIAETEKYAVQRVVDSLIVRNCTFKNVYAECIRFYADTDTSTEDAYLLMEHLTFDSTATRVVYIKNNQKTIFRDIIVSNTHLPKQYRMDRASYIVQVQQRGSYVANLDTFNIIYNAPYAPRVGATKGGSVDDATVYAFDPLYENAVQYNYTLLAASPAYGIGHDGSALGDLTWATKTPTRMAFVLVVEGNGSVKCNPPLIAPNYEPGTVVTMTAVPDSGWQFISWSGDLTGTDNPASITVDAAKNVTATFEQGTGIDQKTIVPREYRLEQNYPNPFNPSTTINFSLKKAGKSTMELYNVLGQKISTIFNQHIEAGNHKVMFDASQLPSGVYFYKLTSGDFTSIKKMILMK